MVVDDEDDFLRWSRSNAPWWMRIDGCAMTKAVIFVVISSWIVIVMYQVGFA
jgi:hypothetical protein